jgi:hypothetical protein
VIFRALLVIAYLLALLGGAIQFAYRSARNVPGSSDQSRRILIPACAFTLGITVYSLLALAGRAGTSFVVVTAFTAFIINGVGSLVLISLVDVVAKSMGARRTRSWLIAGLAAFVGSVALALLISTGAFSGSGIAVLLQPDLIALIILAAAAALIWWSYLPGEPLDAAIFE